ncbi:STAS/SEC14 domain-containing protein [Vibrio viridaestus]|uniref:STAS/SEC14 domain-containing protein n=2 Tax=Vibrio viridaestus TaxID=2487322 RepID=A0A3N9UA09_9VIBR|nr:STAS/SEC14 domain-containing protein [Vibrio viridaestus]
MNRHSITFGMERYDQQMVLLLSVKGKLTHEDYLDVTPMLESAFSEAGDKHVKMLVDIEDFSGWEARAAWDDFKLGLKHKADFEKIAIYGHKSWQQGVAKIADWFIAGHTKSFENYQSAIIWLTS